jgi:hypothetical protein
LLSPPPGCRAAKGRVSPVGPLAAERRLIVAASVLHGGRAKQVSAKAGGLSISHTNGYIAGDFHEDGRLLSFREFVSKHAFSRYCSQKTQVFVKRTALFREEVRRLEPLQNPPGPQAPLAPRTLAAK